MNQCAQCGTSTEGGQFYRFFFGTIVDASEYTPEAEGNRLDPGPLFRMKGSEDVYYCDRCLVRAAAREEMIRGSLFLVVGLFAVVVVSILVLISNPALWAALVALLVSAALGGAAFQRYRRLRAALCASDRGRLREAVASNTKIQNMGDEWAIARRRQALQADGAELFLTQRDNALWSKSEDLG